MNISDGTEFFAHEISVNFNPTQFTLDFKCITPRVDPRSKEKATFSLKHNVVMLDVWSAKQFHGILTTALKQYEGQFGKIDLPKALKKIKKEQEKNAPKKVKNEVKKTTMPSYLG